MYINSKRIFQPIVIFNLALGLFSSVVKADILFIDLNNVEAEIVVARQEAAKRGEKLIILPTDRQKFKNENREYSRISMELNHTYTKLDKCEETGKECESLRRTAESLNGRLSKLTKIEYDVNMLNAELANLSSNISTVMISGHDGDGSFNGDFGSIRSDQFLAAFKKFKGRNDIQSLYLLGCNSVTAHTLGGLWKASFPNAKFIAGYEETGYLRENAQGHEFIRGLLSQEKNILASKTAEEAMRKFQRISPTNPKYGTAACFHPSDQEPQFFSIVQKKNVSLRNELQCKDQNIQEVVDFVECCTSGQKSSCLFPKVKLESLILSPHQLNSCSFAQPAENSVELEKIKDKLYLLAQLQNRFSRYSFSEIFRHADSSLRSRFSLDEPVVDFVSGKEKLSKIREYYSQMADWDNLKDASYGEISSFQEKKEHFDRVWLGVSNLNIEAINRRGRLPDPGEFKAQLLFQKVMQSGDAGLFEKRKSEIEQKLQETTSQSDKPYFKTEVAALQKLKREYDQLISTENLPANTEY